MSSENGEDFITQLLVNGSVLGPFKIMRLEDRGALGELYVVEQNGRVLALNAFTADNIRAYQFAQWLHTQKAYALVAVGRVAEIHYVAMEYHVSAPWFPYRRLLERWDRLPPVPAPDAPTMRAPAPPIDWVNFVPALLVALGVAVIAVSLRKAPTLASKSVPLAATGATAPTSTTPMSLWLRRDEFPQVSWKPALRDATLEVAATADFKTPLVRETVTGTATRLKKTLEDGRYFWRLNGGRAFEMTLSRNEPPHILAPLPGQVIDIPQALASVPLTFAWRCKPGASVYRVQLSEHFNFLSVLKDVVISGCQWPDVSMFPGAHYLRVRTEVPTGVTSEWSAPVPFRIKSY